MSFAAPSEIAVEISNILNAISTVKSVNQTFLKFLAANPSAVNLPGGLTVAADGSQVSIEAGDFRPTAVPRVVVHDGSALMEYSFDVRIDEDEVLSLSKFYLSTNGRIYTDVNRQNAIGDFQIPAAVGVILADVQAAVFDSKLYAPRK